MRVSKIVAIGGSAGGVNALQELVRELGADLDAAVFVVVHIWPDGESLLPEILSSSGRLPAKHAKNGDRIQAGRIYVAPPDHHMTVQRGVVRLDRGPSENRHRPAIDALFRSAARSYDANTVGVLLSGSDDDGSAGLLAIRRAGGMTIVQDPAESLFPFMPLSAIRNGAADHKLTIPGIAAEVRRFVGESSNGAGTAPEIKEPAMEPPAPVYSCPECGGGMYEVMDGELIRFRCRVGHVLSPESMIAAEDDSVERALWAAIRSLEDQAAVLTRLSEKGATSLMGPRYRERASENHQHAGVIRGIVEKIQDVNTSEIPSSTSKD